MYSVVRFQQTGDHEGTDNKAIMSQKQISDLDAKIKTLSFRVKKTDEILQKDGRVASERDKNLPGECGDRGEAYSVVRFRHQPITIDANNTKKQSKLEGIFFFLFSVSVIEFASFLGSITSRCSGNEPANEDRTRETAEIEPNRTQAISE